MTTREFHFSIGPVQDFVSQARRTRDYWAGSFLLSYLAGVAMCEAEKQGAEIGFPRVDPRYLRAIRGAWTPKDGEKPRQGRVPNRFKAIQVPGDFRPEAVAEAVRLAWRAVAGEVWRFLPKMLKEEEHAAAKEVWWRQIGLEADGSLTPVEPFWQIHWALTENPADSDVIDRRKNLRIDLPPAEPGAKCMLMDGWQELSGLLQPTQNRLDEFWNPLCRDLCREARADLRPGEQLSAMALVKRFFPYIFQDVHEKMPSGWQLHGWEVPRAVPSVVYLSAVPWLRQVLPNAPVQELREFHRAVQQLGAKYGERHSDVRWISEALDGLPASMPPEERKLREQVADLDGEAFFENRLKNPEEFLNRAEVEDLRNDPRQRQKRECQGVEAAKALRAVHKNKSVDLPAPASYYASLLMDGDSLGKNMANPDNQPVISGALEAFTDAVPEIVEEHSGFLIYAGGDDVAALLPAPTALDCALALRECYERCFVERQSSIPTSLSGAVLFAHHRLPLIRVLRRSHVLLDDVAKEGRGRDALAVSVESRGGEILTWAMPWEAALEPVERPRRLILAAIAAEMADEKQQAPFSHRFFYRIRQLLELVNPGEGSQTPGLNPDEAVKLMTGEYVDSGIHKRTGKEWTDKDRKEAQRQVERLLAQCRPRVRTLKEDGEAKAQDAWSLDPRWQADGAFLVKFLATRGTGFEGGAA